MFETGPPQYLVETLAELERRSQKTESLVEKARRYLKIFPTWSNLPTPRKTRPSDVEFVYDNDAWDAALLPRQQEELSQQLLESKSASDKSEQEGAEDQQKPSPITRQDDPLTRDPSHNVSHSNQCGEADTRHASAKKRPSDVLVHGLDLRQRLAQRADRQEPPKQRHCNPPRDRETKCERTKTASEQDDASEKKPGVADESLPGSTTGDRCSGNHSTETGSSALSMSSSSFAPPSISTHSQQTPAQTSLLDGRIRPKRCGNQCFINASFCALTASTNITAALHRILDTGLEDCIVERSTTLTSQEAWENLRKVALAKANELNRDLRVKVDGRHGSNEQRLAVTYMAALAKPNNVAFVPRLLWHRFYNHDPQPGENTQEDASELIHKWLDNNFLEPPALRSPLLRQVAFRSIQPFFICREPGCSHQHPLAGREEGTIISLD